MYSERSGEGSCKADTKGTLSGSVLLHTIHGQAGAWAGQASCQVPLQWSVPLKSSLAKGAYVFMWRVLSGDGHIVTGQSVFHIR